AITAAWHAFHKYYSMTDAIPAYGASLLLHPSRRKEYIGKNWKPSWRNKGLKSA
ncbi:hypothetical protein GQ44DRAFT_576298, partial [Phaeosphaeriaceae sp. PMI808]